MKIELEDVMFWMDAVRDSEDRYRTLESFWKGQIRSKQWLVEAIDSLRLYGEQDVVIHGGWYGVLASLMFNSHTSYKNITSVDIDPECEKIANTINKRYEMEGRFHTVTSDMCTHEYTANIVVNTCCEHITQEQYNQWLGNVPKEAIIVLQSNDYFEHEEHIRCAIDLDDFIRMSQLNVIWAGEMELPKYKRFMLIGRTNA